MKKQERDLPSMNQLPTATDLGWDKSSGGDLCSGLPDRQEGSKPFVFQCLPGWISRKLAQRGAVARLESGV